MTLQLLLKTQFKKKIAPQNTSAQQHRFVDKSKLFYFKIKNYLFQSIDCSIMKTILVRDTTKDI
jgi:hypothetical protein